VCSHPTLLEPVFLSIALQRMLSAVTYSLSRLSEVISPTPTETDKGAFQGQRNHAVDAAESWGCGGVPRGDNVQGA